MTVNDNTVNKCCFLPFPFYTKNTNYSVTFDSVIQTNVGAITPSASKKRNGIGITFTSSSTLPLAVCDVTITFA